MANDQIVWIDGNGELHGNHSWFDELNGDQLRKWLPDANEFCNPQSEAFSFVPLSIDKGALIYSVVRSSRTIGVKEQVINKIKPISRADLVGFYQSPALYSYYCLSNGVFSCDQPTELPEVSFFDPRRWAAELEQTELAAIAHSIKIHDELVIFYSRQPAKILASLTSLISEEERWSMSFVYGAIVSESNRFKLSVCSETDKQSKRVVLERNIRYFEPSMQEFSATA